MLLEELARQDIDRLLEAAGLVVQEAAFVYESADVETYYRDLRAPDPRSRRVFAFLQAATLAEPFGGALDKLEEKWT